MPATNNDFARAVTEALRWMGQTPATASSSLGIKPPTMNAMCSGIVPMRSLVIRFAEEVGRQSAGQEGAPDWWQDVDAWLAVAGYPPRRDILPASRLRTPDPEPAAGPPAPEREEVAALSSAPHPTPAGPDEDVAANYYRPAYERMAVGDTFVHIFWLIDRNDEKTHQFRFPACVDYRRRAQALKHDLARMPRVRFERHYAHYRIEKA